MIESFIKQTTKLLASTDIKIYKLSFRDVTINEDEIPSVTFSGRSALFSHLNLNHNLILQLMIFFGVLDAKIDTLHPELEDEPFNRKYNLLPQGDDSKIILKQLYRMLILLRNAAVHNKEAISFENNTIICKPGIKEFTLTKLGLEFIYSAVFQILNPLTANKEYNSGILRRYYDEIKTNVITFKDANGEGLSNISNEIRLQIAVRYEVKNPTYTFDENDLTILKPYDTGSENNGADYLIHFEGHEYIVPSEALSSSNKISKKNLNVWVRN